MTQALSVAVLMGGPSAESAISLHSGRGVVSALTRRDRNITPLIIPEDLSSEDAVDWTRHALRDLAPDVVFLALHGAFGEDGAIQQLCEEMQLAYTGSDAAASRLGLDKVASRRRFTRAGLHVPRWCVASDPMSGRRAGGVPGREDPVLLDGVPYPLIVKPSNQGSSLGVTKVMRPRDLDRAVEQAGRYSATVIVEEYLPGREVTVGLIGTRVLPVVEIVPTRPWFDFAAKYTPGMTEYHVPAPLAPDVTRTVQDAAQRAHDAIGCRHCSRVDIILSETQVPVILEINTIPGFTPTSLLPRAAASVGMSYEALCEQLLTMAWETSRQPSSV